MSYPKFRAGTRVKCKLSGRIYTVVEQRGCQVWLRGVLNSWWHPTNLSRLPKEQKS